jgi:hypothetical protein
MPKPDRTPALSLSHSSHTAKYSQSTPLLSDMYKAGCIWDKDRLRIVEWPREEVENPAVHYSSLIMDTFGKVIQDSFLEPAWLALDPSRAIGPPLFLLIQDHTDLRLNINE